MIFSAVFDFFGAGVLTHIESAPMMRGYAEEYHGGRLKIS
jgi:hypothetical protein